VENWAALFLKTLKLMPFDFVNNNQYKKTVVSRVHLPKNRIFCLIFKACILRCMTEILLYIIKDVFIFINNNLCRPCKELCCYFMDFTVFFPDSLTDQQNFQLWRRWWWWWRRRWRWCTFCMLLRNLRNFTSDMLTKKSLSSVFEKISIQNMWNFVLIYKMTPTPFFSSED
jgi:hypothetical protein